MNALLDVRDIHVCFHTHDGDVEAVRGASFTVDWGEVVAIVGESGSGKSILTQACLRLIAASGEVTQGQALFEGRDFLQTSETDLLNIRGREVSIIFQDAMTALNPTMRIDRQITEMILEHAGFSQKEGRAYAKAIADHRDDENAVAEILTQALRATPAELADDQQEMKRLFAGNADEQAIFTWLMQRAKITPKQANRRAVELLRMVKIPEPEKRMRQYIFQCSGGMRQRVMIAMALACRPKLVIADEPTTALDVTIKTEILDLLVSLTKQLGTSIILITHDLATVASYADHIGVMYGGQFVEKGTSEHIFYESQHPYTKGLLKAVPRLDLPKTQQLTTIPGSPPNPLHMPQGCAFGPRCPHCMEICKLEMPPETTVSQGHTTRCWLNDPRAAISQGGDRND